MRRAQISLPVQRPFTEVDAATSSQQVVLKQQHCTITSPSTSGLNTSAVSLPSSPWSGGGAPTATCHLCITGRPLWMWPYRRKLWGLHPRAKEPRRTKDKHSSRLRFIWENHPSFLPGPHSFATASATPIAINMCWKRGNWCGPDAKRQISISSVGE